MSRSFLVRSFQADGTPVMKTVGNSVYIAIRRSFFFAEKRTPDRRLRLSGVNKKRYMCPSVLCWGIMPGKISIISLYENRRL